MCYQCAGCGRCLNKGLADNGKRICTRCGTEVEDGVDFCPTCHMYIRPRPGSIPREPKKEG